MTNNGLDASFLPHDRRVIVPDGLHERLYRVFNDTFARELTPGSVRRVFSRIRERKIPNYCRDSVAFTYLYYPANFAKAFVAARQFFRGRTSSPTSIIDLGAGSGAATAGVLEAARQVGAPIYRIVAVDRCDRQLRLFEQITGGWLRDSAKQIDVEIVESDALEYLRQSQPNGMVVASYLRCELGDLALDFNSLLKTVHNQDPVLVVDKIPNEHGTVIEIGDKTFRLPAESMTVHAGRVSCLPLPHTPKFCDLSCNNNRALPDIVKRYFLAWQQQDVEAIRDLFVPDCIYEINRLEGETTRLQGIGQVAEYWQRNATNQRDMQWHVNAETIERDVKGICFPWWVEFDRTDRNERYVVSGRMQIDAHYNKIYLLSEYYCVEKSARKTLPSEVS